MEYVTSEKRRKREWYYSDGYYISKEGEVMTGKIATKDLINPEVIYNKRLQIQKSLPLNKRGLYRVNPDPVTTELWNDWQRRQSVGEAEIAD